MITILTLPIPENINLLAKRFFKLLIMLIKGQRGPKAVKDSILNGLNENGIESNINPIRKSKLNKNILVLSDLNALKQAVRLKKDGIIDKIIAGPNIVILPSDDKIISSKYIDKYLVNSEWTKNIYIQDEPSLKDKLVIWPAGTNTNYWEPKNNHKKNILIYLKNTQKQEVNDYINTINDMTNLNIKYLEYGHYNKKQYYDILNDAKFAIFFTKSESQGIALAECWSMNVPTLVKKCETIIVNNKEYNASSAPYLNEKTGLFFDSIENFKFQLNKIMHSDKIFSPREWVIENMSDKECAKDIINLFKTL